MSERRIDSFPNFWKLTFLPEIHSQENNPIYILFKNKTFKMQLKYCKQDFQSICCVCYDPGKQEEEGRTLKTTYKVLTTGPSI